MLFLIQILIIITDCSSFMQYSKLQQIAYHPQTKKEHKAELVIGISDYIPFALKNSSSISISIEGQYKSIIENILWSEFFTKTLLKQCQHHLLLHSYTSEGKTGNHPLFVKSNGKIYKLEECLEWKSLMMTSLLQQKVKKGEISIEGFSQAGKVKTIRIFFGSGARNSHTDVLLRLLPSAFKAEQICRNNIESEINTFRTNEKQNEKSYKTMSVNSKTQPNFIHFSKVPTQQSNNDKISFKFDSISNVCTNRNEKSRPKSKTSVKNVSNKQNNKTDSLPPKMTKNKSNKSTSRSKATPATSTISRPALQQTQCNVPEMIHVSLKQSTQNRESVLSKIITSKEQQIINLKTELINQELHYEDLLNQQKEQHQEQEEVITNNIKKLLEEYEATQKQHLDENNYLKERVKVLEDGLVRCETQQEQYLIEKESLFRVRRELETTIKQNSEIYKKSKEQLQAQITSLRQENENKSADVKKWMEKCMMFQKKYDDLVGVMRLSLPKDQ